MNNLYILNGAKSSGQHAVWSNNKNLSDKGVVVGLSGQYDEMLVTPSNKWLVKW
jgi:hypothetical protein